MSNNAKTEDFINIADRVRPFGRGDGSGGGTGPQGPAGPTGPQGPAGADGVAGADGAQGVAGADGAQGIQGLQGPVGAQGPAGVAGAVAPAGLLWKGQWATATSYELNNTVGFGGASYFCIDFVNPYVADPTVYPSNHVSDGTEVGKHIVFLQDSSQLGTAGGGVAVNISLAKSYEITGFNTPNSTVRVVDDSGTDIWCKMNDAGHPRNRGVAWEFGTAQTTNDPTVDTTNWALMASEGAPGADGSQGADGAQGAPGPTGPQGLTGPAGPAGATGADGADGAMGPQGPAGADAGQIEVVNSQTKVDGTSVGQFAYEEDTERFIIWNGTTWLSLQAVDRPIAPIDVIIDSVQYADFIMAPADATFTVTEEFITTPTDVSVSIAY